MATFAQLKRQIWPEVFWRLTPTLSSGSCIHTALPVFLKLESHSAGPVFLKLGRLPCNTAGVLSGSERSQSRKWWGCRGQRRKARAWGGGGENTEGGLRKMLSYLIRLFFFIIYQPSFSTGGIPSIHPWDNFWDRRGTDVPPGYYSLSTGDLGLPDGLFFKGPWPGWGLIQAQRRSSRPDWWRSRKDGMVALCCPSVCLLL